MRRRVGASFVAALFFAQLCLAGDCVDGVTPDCSDAAAQCGPDLDGAVLDGPKPSDSSAADTGVGGDTGTTNDSGGGAGDGGGDAEAGDQ